MDFVVDVLRDVFLYGTEKAESVMLKIHQDGKGIAGVYSKEIAWMRTKKCNKYAQQKGHPLMVTMEAE
jgi:ATP-dependent Clp protease adaptor protein ClpS